MAGWVREWDAEEPCRRRFVAGKQTLRFPSAL